LNFEALVLELTGPEMNFGRLEMHFEPLEMNFGSPESLPACHFGIPEPILGGSGKPERGASLSEN